MSDEPLQKGALLCNAGGRTVWSTTHPDLVMIQYRDPALVGLVEYVSRALLAHGIRSAYRDEYASTLFVAANLEMVDLRAVVHVRGGNVEVALCRPDGPYLNRQQAERVVNPRQLDCMVDEATHAGRVLRARLLLAGSELVEAQFRFGKLTDHGCMMDAFDPLLCRFWDQESDAPVTDYGHLLERLGGKRQ